MILISCTEGILSHAQKNDLFCIHMAMEEQLPELYGSCFQRTPRNFKGC